MASLTVPTPESFEDSCPLPSLLVPSRTLPQRDTLSRLAQRSMVWSTRALLGAEACWAGCKPSKRQRIYIANHTSHADAVLLWSALPADLREQTHPVAAADYWNANLLRRYFSATVLRSILVERERLNRRHNPLDLMCTAVERGESLILFPEGTRGAGGEPGAFKCGLYHLARRCPEVELVPVWIANASRSLPKGAVVPVPLLCSITFGVPTRLRDDEDKQTFLERLRAAVISTGGSCPSVMKS